MSKKIKGRGIHGFAAKAEKSPNLVHSSKSKKSKRKHSINNKPVPFHKNKHQKVSTDWNKRLSIDVDKV